VKTIYGSGARIENSHLKPNFAQSVVILYPKPNLKKQLFVLYVICNKIKLGTEKGKKLIVSCRICSKKEKGAEPYAIYICSTCTYKLGSMPHTEARTVIDQLYLAGRAEDAQFVERLAFGSNTNSSETPQLKKRTVPITVRRRKSNGR